MNFWDRLLIERKSTPQPGFQLSYKLKKQKHKMLPV